MNFPGFTAELVLSNKQQQNWIIPAVIFDGPGKAGCIADCMENCLSTGQSNSQCKTKCNKACTAADGPVSTPAPPNPNSAGCIGCEVAYAACQISALGGLFGLCSAARKSCRQANNC